MPFPKIAPFTIILFALILSSCKKDGNSDNSVTTGETIVVKKLDGYVYTDIPNAVVECAGQTTTADSRGYFSFSNISVNNETAKITIKRPSLTYTKQPELVRSFIPAATGVYIIANLAGQLLSNYSSFNNQSSGSITSLYYYPTNILDFDANTFADKTTNTIINGNVIVDAALYSYLGSFGQLTTSGGIPYSEIHGSNYGIAANGTEVGLSIQSVLLKCYFKSAAGNDVKLSAGKKLKLKANGNFTLTPLPTQPIYLWYFDASKNRWIQDVQAVAIPNSGFDGYYSAETDKLSNDYLFAYAYPVVKLTAKIISSFDNKPVVNSLVRFAKQGDKTIMGTAYTDEDGNITTLVPKDVSLDLNLLSSSSQLLTNTTSEDAIFKVNIGVKSANADLGTITASSNTLLTSTMLFNFKGVAVDCNKNPLTNGIITIYDDYNLVCKTKVESNGNFSVNYTRPAGHSSLYWFATNSTNNDFSRLSTDLYVWKNWLASQAIKKNYSVDTIILCNQNTSQFIELTIDGTKTTYSTPASTFRFTEPLGGINYGFVFIQQVEMLGSTQLTFRYEGDRAKGIKSYVGGLYYNNQLLTYIGTPPNVNVTDDEYNGSNFVSGFFNSSTVKYPDNSTHTFSCKFRVKR